VLLLGQIPVGGWFDNVNHYKGSRQGYLSIELDLSDYVINRKYYV
jgi:hypothetical protein